MTETLLWGDILEAVQAGRKAVSELDKYLVNGYLLVTPDQYKKLREQDDEETAKRWRRGDYAEPPPPLSSIPVLVVYPDRMPLDVGDGWRATYQDGGIYAFNINSELNRIDRILRAFGVC